MAKVGEGEGKDSRDSAGNWDILETNLLKHRHGCNEEDEMLNEYRVQKVLGRGSFGIVKKCLREVNEPPYREFALKVMPLLSQKPMTESRL
jgi:serine/threonine protein kinase